MNVCIFCSFITQTSFFCTVIPEICLTASVIHSTLNLITNVDFVVTLGPEAEHLMINLVCKLVSLSIRFEIRISSHSLMLNQ